MTPTRRAFTLIEAITAVVVLALALPAMLGAIASAHRERSRPMQASIARWLAVEKIEDVIADRHSAARGWSYLAAGNYAGEAGVTGYPAFARTVALAEYADASLTTLGEGYMLVTVTVSWTDAGGDEAEFPLSTVLTEYDP